ncbi:MAG: FIST C-terminal domain-containing protein [Spirochaetaceae bacterium]|jgi:hypothetical protein|nr:FIST C-terminal domain-containing protein [Spirochaetaceae bacterium]
MLTAHTVETDDVDAAVREILEQLDINRNIQKNSVGLIFCYVDFIESGVVEAVCKALPFDVLGCTTLGIALPEAVNDDMLALVVLTSDEVVFSAGVSEALGTDAEARITRLYETVSASAAAPSLLLAFEPTMSGFLGEVTVSVLDRLSKGRPIFGASALDMNTNVRSPKTIYNGAAYSDRLALLLLSGGREPQFFVDSIPHKKTRSQQAVITEAEGNRMFSINNMSAVSYMERIGLINDGVIDLLYAFPLVIDNHDGEKPWPCVIVGIGPDGALLCGGSILPGSTLSIGSPLGEDVLTTAARIVEIAKQKQDRDGLLIFSCFSRNVALVDSGDEMKLVQKLMADSSLPYIFLYSAGEICPLCTGDGKIVNRFHQYSIISCIL